MSTVTQLKQDVKAVKSSMTRLQATKEAIRMRKNGASSVEIADHLANSGFRGKGGKLLSSAAVNYMLVSAGQRIRKKRLNPAVSAAAAKKAVPSVGRASKNVTDAVRNILKIKMDSDEKLALIALVLDRK